MNQIRRAEGGRERERERERREEGREKAPMTEPIIEEFVPGHSLLASRNSVAGTSVPHLPSHQAKLAYSAVLCVSACHNLMIHLTGLSFSNAPCSGRLLF